MAGFDKVDPANLYYGCGTALTDVRESLQISAEWRCALFGKCQRASLVSGTPAAGEYGGRGDPEW